MEVQEQTELQERMEVQEQTEHQEQTAVYLKGSWAWNRSLASLE